MLEKINNYLAALMLLVLAAFGIVVAFTVPGLIKVVLLMATVNLAITLTLLFGVVALIKAVKDSDNS